MQLFRHRDQDPAVEDNVVVAAARRRGLLPALLALLAIATTDVVFALDSIPAVFGVTQHAYIVFVAALTPAHCGRVSRPTRSSRLTPWTP